MLILEIENNQIKGNPLTLGDLQFKFPNTSFPLQLTDKVLPENHVLVYTETNEIFNGTFDIKDKILFNEELNKWVITKYIEPTPVVDLIDLKKEKLNQLYLYTENVIKKITDSENIPSQEVQSWMAQGQEAIAWKLNPESPTPILDTIATARNIPKDILKQKAYEKAIAYQKVLAYIIGKRQAIEDRINIAKESIELHNIKIEINLT
ncbi:MAG: hypothetical protein [Bacteriophage sp.]|nr:MAG: hypothetical protein [Bacteriophage sp.]